MIGAPDPEMGERVVAVVQPARWEDAGVAFSKELEAYLRERISHVKVPKEISFSKELPRHDTGKLYKRLIKVSKRSGRASVQTRCGRMANIPSLSFAGRLLRQSRRELQGRYPRCQALNSDCISRDKNENWRI